MIISTPHTKLGDQRFARTAGFSLVEVMVAAALSTLILTAVLGAFNFIGRSGFRASNYSQIEAQIRRGLDTFSNDARMAKDIQWNSAQSITLSLPTAGSGSDIVTYAYDSSTTGDTAQSFYRMSGYPGSGNARRILVRDLDPTFNFARFKLEQNGVTNNSATNDLETKLIQINLKMAQTAPTAGQSSQESKSARYLLRNKRVSN